MTLEGTAQVAAPIARTNGPWTPQSAARQTHLRPSQPHNENLFQLITRYNLGSKFITMFL